MNEPQTATVTVSRPGVAEWIYAECDKRTRAGMSVAEAVGEVKAMVQECDRLQELWDEYGQHLVTHLFVAGQRVARARAKARPTPATSTPKYEEMARVWPSDESATPPALNGVEVDSLPRFAPRHDVEVLRRSVFDATIQVGKRAMRYGDMKSEHWELKAAAYRTLADNGTTRAWAASKIAKRIPGDLTTQEVFSEEDFKALIPAIGF